MNTTYPAGPQTVPPDLTLPTTTYKRRAWLALASIAVFLALYLFLAGWFGWTAYRMFKEVASGGGTLTYVIVGGCSAFLAVFMLKALVFLRRGETPDAVEVTAAEQPRLFSFLHRLADEAGAPRPNRVFLSARVNAAVFFDMSVLNLVFPSRKNLEIGLALVNVLTLSEFKAVVAHEFGHFAQRSMAIGSWVYIAQQIAAHIVAKRDALDKLLQFLSHTDVRIAWLGWILSLVVWSIRSLMDTLLRLVILAQRSLSRQMEFQADLVAVSLTGSDELVHALHKLHAADDAWGRAINFATAQIREGRIPHDLFAVQLRIIDRIGEILNEPEYGKAPTAAREAPEARRIFKTAFAQPPQMWSTHPSNADREQNAKQRYLSAPHDASSSWILFDDADSIKSGMIARLVGQAQATPTSAEQTFASLDQQYSKLQYDPRFRGAYLGRPLTRHVANAMELYDSGSATANLLQSLNSLYPEELGESLSSLRALAEERAMLEALRDKTFRATGGRIVFRGREIKRRELPSAIRTVLQEESGLREKIFAHDRRCRNAHLAAASLLGGGWSEYMRGVIGALHYAEHSLANLRDAQGLLGNVLAVVTADGKVSKSELKRLLAAANMLHGEILAIHEQKAGLVLDESLCSRLRIESWAGSLEEFKLTPATKENINDWLRAVDGWVESVAGPLAALLDAAMEQLLATEDDIARHLRDRSTPAPACTPTTLPPTYPTLVTGKERKRQTRLGLWDRFQTADGVAAAVARLLVAGTIIGMVLGFANVTGVTSTVSIYNGLGRAVQANVAGQKVFVAPYSAREIEVPLTEDCRIEATTDNGTLIESFTPPLGGHGQHYVYNVAGASPLVEWTATYGSATEVPPRLLGLPKWTTSSAEFFFAEPPKSVQTKSTGATRLVLAGLGERAPNEVLSALRSDQERRQVIDLHAKWDLPNSPHSQEWKSLASTSN
jgi:Zn-dependent protease with chaperone function